MLRIKLPLFHQRCAPYLLLALFYAQGGLTLNPAQKLKEAINQNDLESVEKLYNKKFSPLLNSRIYQYFSMTAVEYAVDKGKFEIVKLLIKSDKFQKIQDISFYKSVFEKLFKNGQWQLIYMLFYYLIANDEYPINEEISSRENFYDHILSIKNKKMITDNHQARLVFRAFLILNPDLEELDKLLDNFGLRHIYLGKKIIQIIIDRNLVKSAQNFISLVKKNNYIESYVFLQNMEVFFNLNPRYEEIIVAINNSGTKFMKGLVINEAIIRHINLTSNQYLDLVKKLSYIHQRELLFNSLEDYIDIFPDINRQGIVSFLYSSSKANRRPEYLFFIERVNNKLKDKENIFENFEKQAIVVNHLEKQIKKRKKIAIKRREKLSLIKQNNRKIYDCAYCGDKVEKINTLGCINSNCHYKNLNLVRCDECQIDEMAFAAKEGNYPLKCRACDDHIFIDNQIEEKLVKKDPYIQRTRKLQINAIFKEIFKDSVSCSSTNCANIIRKIDCNSNGEYTCGFCEKSYCYKCGEHHSSLKCDGYKVRANYIKSVKETVLNSHGTLRLCPHCFKMSQKIEGCSSVHCTSCHTKWDWRFPGRLDNALLLPQEIVVNDIEPLDNKKESLLNESISENDLDDHEIIEWQSLQKPVKKIQKKRVKKKIEKKWVDWTEKPSDSAQYIRDLYGIKNEYIYRQFIKGLED